MAPAKISKRKPALSTALKLALQPGKRGQWEGAFVHTSSSPNESYFVRACIGLAGGALQGEGSLFRNESDAHGIDIELAGSLDKGEVDFAVWIHVPGDPEPITCIAQLDLEGGVMRGEWHHPCYQPDTCKCRGGGGTFELNRVGGQA